MVVLNKMDLVKRNRREFGDAFRAWLGNQFDVAVPVVCVSAVSETMTLETIDTLACEMNRLLTEN
jgi:hypothetical protein